MRALIDLIEKSTPPIADARYAALERWFAGSKVVNADGSPKVMYHGTRNEIRRFDINRASPDALYGPGFYFTDTPHVAGGLGPRPDRLEDVEWSGMFNLAGYAFQGTRFETGPLTRRQMAHAKRIFLSKRVEQEAREDIGVRRGYEAGWRALQGGEEAFREWLANSAPRWFRERLRAERERTTRPNVMPVYLSIKSPLYLDQPAPDSLMRDIWAATGEHTETFENATCGLRGSQSAPTGGDVWNWTTKRLGVSPAGTNKLFQRLGYDGFNHGGGQIVRTMGEHRVWVAFRPEQIKSIFSAGFDDASENVDESAHSSR